MGRELQSAGETKDVVAVKKRRWGRHLLTGKVCVGAGNNSFYLLTHLTTLPKVPSPKTSMISSEEGSVELTTTPVIIRQTD